MPPIPPGASDATYPIAAAIDGATFVEVGAASVGEFSYYPPPRNGSLHPLVGDSEGGEEVTIYASGLDAAGGGGGGGGNSNHMRCKFGEAGTSPVTSYRPVE